MEYTRLLRHGMTGGDVRAQRGRYFDDSPDGSARNYLRPGR